MHKSINFNLPHDGTRDNFIRRKDVLGEGGGSEAYNSLCL